MKLVILKSYPTADLADRWNASLAEMPYATQYVSPAYFLDPYVGGNRFAVLVEEDDGSISGVLTGVTDGKTITSGVFSRPQVVFRNGAAVAALIDGLQSVSPGASITEIFTWQRLPTADSFRVQESGDDTSVVMLDLSLGPDALFTGFSQTRRNELRKAIKQDLVEIRELETEAELAELYQIYLDWNTRKGNSVDTIENMQQAAAMRENRRTFIATVEGMVIAGSFYRFCPSGVVEYAANFSIPRYQRLRPNDLIAWHAIQWASNAGCRYFSMGGSHLFLRRFGGDVITTFKYRQDNSLLRLNGIKENAREAGFAAFHRLPANVQAGVKRVLAR